MMENRSNLRQAFKRGFVHKSENYIISDEPTNEWLTKSETVSPKVYKCGSASDHEGKYTLTPQANEEIQKVLRIPKVKSEEIPHDDFNTGLPVKNECDLSFCHPGRKRECKSLGNVYFLDGKNLRVCIRRVKVDSELLKKTIEYYKQLTITSKVKVKQEEDQFDVWNSSYWDVNMTSVHKCVEIRDGEFVKLEKEESELETKFKEKFFSRAEEMPEKYIRSKQGEVSNNDPEIKSFENMEEKNEENHRACEDAAKDDSILRRKIPFISKISESNSFQGSQQEEIPQKMSLTSKKWAKKHNYTCPFCAKSFVDLCTLISHKNVHSTKFECRYCSKTFAHSTDLRTHLRIHTGERPFSCHICGKAFTQKSNLRTHLKIHSDARPHRCSTCKMSFKLKQSLKDHIRVRHLNEKVFCDHCQRSFAERTTLLSHIRTVHLNDDFYQCDKCGKVFKRKDYLRIHIEFTHAYRESKVACTVCGKHMRKDQLKTHLKFHAGSRPYKCKYCGSSFTQNSHLHSHYKVHSNSFSYFCNECGKGFKHREHLRYHLQTHSKSPAYSCTTCGKSYQVERALKVHIRANHTDSSKWPYSCKVCNKRFYSKFMMKSHMVSHTKHRNFKCTQCSNTYRYKGGLLEHLKSHTTKKTYRCKYCNVEFSVYATLMEHRKQCYIPFYCNECGVGIKTKTKLVAHCRFHLEKHTCLICRYGFISEGSLKSHNTMKHGDRSTFPYACDICFKKFASELGFKLHKAKHSDTKEHQKKSAEGNFVTGTKIED